MFVFCKNNKALVSGTMSPYSPAAGQRGVNDCCPNLKDAQK